MKPAQRTKARAAEKTCMECGEDWPADTEFLHRAADTNDHLSGQCKACRSAYDTTADAMAQPPCASTANAPKGCKACSPK